MSRRAVLLLVLPLLWLAVLASSAGAIYCEHRSRELFIQLEALNGRRDNLQIEWGQLQLEQSAWSSHAFVSVRYAMHARRGSWPSACVTEAKALATAIVAPSGRTWLR